MNTKEKIKNFKKIASILRVNHAGELGAKQIYKAQLRFLGKDKNLELMQTQELKHLKIFEQLMVENNIDPSIMQPIWHVLSYLMGAVSGIISKDMAHICTVAVETVIVKHYQSQIESLDDNDDFERKLKTTLIKIQQEEQEHCDISQDELGGKQTASSYIMAKKIIELFTKTAIKISEKI